MRRLVMVAMALGMMATGRAEAAIVLTATESNGTVIISGCGTLDLTGLRFEGGGRGRASVDPPGGTVLVGPVSFVSMDLYSGFAGPQTFGPIGGSNSITLASSGSGDGFGIGGGTGILGLPVGYRSLGLLSGTALYNNATFASLGLPVGTYTFVLPKDTFTFQVGPADTAVPEPASLALTASGLVALGLHGHRRSRRRAG